MADEDILELAADFASATHSDWLREVTDSLNGKPFDGLRSETADGIPIEPLYSRADLGALAQFPRTGTGRRASNAAGSTAGWDIRQQHGLWSTEAALNEAILTDLERGVTSVELLDVDKGDLDAILAGVHLELAPIALVGSGDGTALARRYLELAAARNVAPDLLRADLACDPIGHLAGTGSAGAPIADALEAVASLAVHVADAWPGVRSVRVDGLTFADAGAAPATELAAILACGVAYLRSLVDEGLQVEQALSQVLLRTSVGTNQFDDIAKLRALRVLWARVGEVSGATDHRATVQAATSIVATAAVDPWANMVRSTIACFAAAAGGADVITVGPFDAALGAPTELGLRVARNTQLALLEESNLHRVIDPGGGSYYLESLTDQLADEAWILFQELEAEGGVVAALESGSLQARIADQAATQTGLVSTRQRVLVGVNRFANLSETVPAPAEYPKAPDPAAATDVEPLRALRLSSQFEGLGTRAVAANEEPPQ